MVNLNKRSHFAGRVLTLPLTKGLLCAPLEPQHSVTPGQPPGYKESN
jgi:hypothetical protein